MPISKMKNYFRNSLHRFLEGRKVLLLALKENLYE